MNECPLTGCIDGRTSIRNEIGGIGDWTEGRGFDPRRLGSRWYGTVVAVRTHLGRVTTAAVLYGGTWGHDNKT